MEGFQSKRTVFSGYGSCFLSLLRAFMFLDDVFWIHLWFRLTGVAGSMVSSATAILSTCGVRVFCGVSCSYMWLLDWV